MPDYQETITTCSRMLVGKTNVSGQGRQINSPLLNIFLGQDAEAHREDVSAAYQNCWLNSANSLGYLTSQNYSPDNIRNACGTMLSARHVFKRYSAIYLAYFWDIMDDKFDIFLEAVKHPLTFPTAISVESVFFLFCRELTAGAQQKKESRLKSIISWAQETGHHLVVLSDLTPSGLLGPEEIGESYRLAANIMLIADSYFAPGEKDLGQTLTFFLAQKPVYSASYYILKKNTWEIATACLWQILDDYQRLPQSSDQGGNVKDRLCGSNRGYSDFFQKIFDEKMVPLLPQDHSFLRYLPYTEAMGQLDDNLNGVQRRLFPFFGKNSSNQGVSQELAAKALFSIQDVWDTCLELYYRRPVLSWLASEEGVTYIREFFRQKLNLALDYEEMSNLLLEEAESLEQLARNSAWSLPEISERMPLPDWLHQQACRELKSMVFCRLAGILADAMREMHTAAKGFDRVLNEAKAGLQIENMDKNVRDPYIQKTHSLLVSNRELLARKISPCCDQDTLLQQASQVFAELVQSDPVYQFSLKDHYSFLINDSAPAAVDDLINSCFNQDMYLMSRLQTYTPPSGESHMYCMVCQGAFKKHIDPYLHGDVFHVSRNDCIERLLVYSVEPENIIY